MHGGRESAGIVDSSNHTDASGAVTVRESRKIRTGVEGLDRILRGGLPKREIYLVQGEPGTGKTTFGPSSCSRGASWARPVSSSPSPNAKPTSRTPPGRMACP
jgi:predicted ATP-dependent serine protease